MDNCFTHPRTISGARALKVAVVGTARAKRGWPPKEMKAVTDDRFNALCHMNDKDNFVIMRWVDNSIVTMVSSFHTPYSVVTKERRKPRPTDTNKRHLDTVWPTGVHKVAVEIPKVIDDYNHWMLGVDLADQLISYYRPRLRCRRNWMPIMFHMFDCI